MACAACGARRVDRKTTFLVDRPKCSGEFSICEDCWSEGENNEVWNEQITQRIIARYAAKAGGGATSPEAVESGS